MGTSKIYGNCEVSKEVEVGDSPNGKPEMVLQVFVPELSKTFSNVLYFSQEAAEYSYERLRAAGWSGADLSDMTGLGSKKVDFEIRYEEYTPPGETQSKTTMKTQIMTGGGRIKVGKPMDLKSFAAKVAILTGKKVPDGVPPIPFG